MPVDLNERIVELHHRISDPSSNNAMFVGQFVSNLVKEGVTIPEVEKAPMGIKKAYSRDFYRD